MNSNISNSVPLYQPYYPQYQYYKMKKCPYQNLKPYNKQIISHLNDLYCFQHCSQWTLTLTSTINKIYLDKDILVGTANNNDTQNQIIPNLPNYLPIDIRANQRFALDRNQPKIYLCLNFDVLKENSTFSNINNDYVGLTFDIQLGALLHGYNIFKDAINFKVKGYDIIKSIHGRLNDKKTAYSTVMKGSTQNYIFQTTVFNNIQCTFGVDFSISNYNLSKFYATNYINNNTIAMFDIKIIKLRIVYSLPLCVFSSLYQPQRVQPLLPIYTYFKKMSQVNNFYRGNMQQSRINFCNWHSFMSNTTPVMYESEELLIKDIFNSLINPSLFGIDCLYKIDQSHYTKVKYFPTLNSIYIEEIDNHHSMLNSNANFNVNNDSSTLDGSFLTSLSSTKDEDSRTNKTKKMIYWKELIAQSYKKPSYQSQLKHIYEKNIGIEDLSLSEISSDSYFSVLWTPSKTSQPKNVSKNLQFVENKNFTSFLVFYHMRSAKIKNSAHFLRIIGIIEQNYYGDKINTVCQQGANECFWFQNKAVNSNQFYSEQDFYLNKTNYCYMLESGCNKAM